MRVLFVDDNAINRTVVKGMLEPSGVEVAEAEDAQSGLAMIELGDYALILMDLRMPGMDGLSAIRRIRARADAKARLPIIVVTADDAPDIRQQAQAAGADDLLQKPVQMAKLFETIGRVLAARTDEDAVLLA
ncbi:response regulator [Phenylobacterium deserti]|uniref:Response regulator n=1 Tax=Phenylobacterium deserti TaxID=1914756 RepID=A0A328ATQ8_9CAUL|nr:response regulator [Phenylobacterium deserti]RAK57949.1 response regulator [Phenylobacterium deserti]